MRYIIVDLEATCWEHTRASERMEIIEIGAVLLTSAAGPLGGEFGRFVRPVVEPNLSEFCQSLTSIKQAHVDAADTFPIIFRAFLAWLGNEPFVFCTWGSYDLHQLRIDCQRHGLALPEAFEHHINLKREFARVFAIQSCGMAAALKHAGLPLQGTHHRGIDDARNTAKLATLVLPRIEQEGRGIDPGVLAIQST